MNPPPKKPNSHPLAILTLAACACLASALTSCAEFTTKEGRDALKKELQNLVIQAGKEVSATALAATLTTLEAELQAAELEPVPPAWQDQLKQQVRISTLRAALTTGRARLLKLQSPPDAKQPSNPNPAALSSEKAQATDSGKPPISQTTKPPSAGLSESTGHPRPHSPLRSAHAATSTGANGPRELRARLRGLRTDEATEGSAGRPPPHFSVPILAPAIVASLRDD